MIRNLLLLMICLLLVVTAGPAPVLSQDQGERRIEGLVFLDTNRDGERQADEPGIGGVAVTVVKVGEATPLTAITDSSGSYLVQGLAPGAYLVEAHPPAGYLCLRCQAEVVLPADPPAPVDLALALLVPWTPTPTGTALPTDTPVPAPTRTPAPSATPGNPVITFYASPDTTRFPGDCTTLFWWVDRATEVFFILPSGQIGVEGSGQHQVCPQSTTTYRLKVNGANGRQEIVEALVVVLPPPTSTPLPPPRSKPILQPPSTMAPTSTLTATATLSPTLTPEPTWTPLPTVVPTPDPLLAGLPVRWGTIALPISSGEAGQ